MLTRGMVSDAEVILNLVESCFMAYSLAGSVQRRTLLGILPAAYCRCVPCHHVLLPSVASSAVTLDVETSGHSCYRQLASSRRG